MKYNEENVEKMTQERIQKSDFWREVYENAPELAKRRLRIAFWASVALDEREDLDEYREDRERTEQAMSYDDFAYLADHFPEGSGKVHYAKMRDEAEFRCLRTPERLDAALEFMMREAPEDERANVDATLAALREVTDAWPEYDWAWKAYSGMDDYCALLGDCFDHGHGLERNVELALFWFRRGVMSGDADCCYRLAHIYEDEEDAEHFSPEAALFWLYEGLRRNNLETKIRIGERLTAGFGWWRRYRDPAMGIRLLRSASKEDNSGQALYHLAFCHECGIGVKVDHEHAKFLMELAAQKDWGNAKDEIARMNRGEWLLPEKDGDNGIGDSET